MEKKILEKVRNYLLDMIKEGEKNACTDWGLGVMDGFKYALDYLDFITKLYEE